jgi:enoyl-CoA hydratase
MMISTRTIGSIAAVEISNPKKYNALTLSMWVDLATRMRELGANENIRAVIVHGDGVKAFAAGADLSQMAGAHADPESMMEINAAAEEAFKALEACPQPTVARIRGVCMGGGLGIAAACDLRICSDDARFRMPAGQLGLGYPYDGVRRYVSLIGPQNTLDIFTTGRTFGAEDAYRMGFVSQIVPAEDLAAVVDEIASAISRQAPLTLKALKLSVLSCLAGNVAPDESARRAIAACAGSSDFAEGLAAFAEKRAPAFAGS